MRESASNFIENWAGLVGRMVGGLDLDGLAAETKALVRRRGVPSAEALLRLALARGPGCLSLRDTAAWAQLAEVADLTDASLNDRLHNSCDFLAAMASAMLKEKVPGADFRWPGHVLRISDGTCGSKPGSKGTDWRVHAVYDLGAAGFSHFEVTDKYGGEAFPLAGSEDRHPNSALRYPRTGRHRSPAIGRTQVPPPPRRASPSPQKTGAIPHSFLKLAPMPRPVPPETGI